MPLDVKIFLNLTVVAEEVGKDYSGLSDRPLSGKENRNRNYLKYQREQ